eukprot:Skav207237  [mRNA]  locus=scaffold523:138739:139239:+ [translate_table: standard]
MDHVAAFCRTLSLQLVNRQEIAYTSLPWPSSKKLYRGTWMPRTEVEFFQEGTEFRVQQLFATSQNELNASGFIHNGQYEKIRMGQLPVLITIVIPDTLCKHVAYLEDLTTEENEAEWLFVAYSAFKVISNDNPQKEADPYDPIKITIQAFPDNREIRDDLPIALWC